MKISICFLSYQTQGGNHTGWYTCGILETSVEVSIGQNQQNLKTKFQFKDIKGANSLYL